MSSKSFITFCPPLHLCCTKTQLNCLSYNINNTVFEKSCNLMQFFWPLGRKKKILCPNHCWKLFECYISPHSTWYLLTTELGSVTFYTTSTVPESPSQQPCRLRDSGDHSIKKEYFEALNNYQLAFLSYKNLMLDLNKVAPMPITVGC